MAKPGLHLTVKCEFCAKWYRQWRSDQRYCSRSCTTKHWRVTHPEAVRGHRIAATPPSAAKGTVAACLRCGGEFTRVSIQHRFCSAKCKGAGAPGTKGATVKFGAGKGHTRGTEIVPRETCRVCGKPFYAPPVLKRRGGGIYCSRACRGREMATNPASFPQTKTRRGNGGRRDDLDGRYFRSSWEANWARYLNWLLERGELALWEYEVDTFEFPVKRGSKFYTPDFKLHYADGSVIYHEVKGYMDQRSATKLKRMKKHYPTVDVRLIDKAAYAQVARAIGAAIPNWETNRGQLVRAS